jgi:RHS repeat-associated protein
MTYKHCFISFILSIILFTAEIVYAQEPLPAPYNIAMPVNTVRIWKAKIPLTQEADISATNRTAREVEQYTEISDGFGRPIQSVIKQGSPAGNDMISAITYDSLGRERFNYLPFVSSSTNGEFKTNPFQQQAAFYNSYLAGQPGETLVGNDQLNWSYSQRNFEASPLNRVISSYSPGATWVGTQSHAMEQRPLVNTSTDNVQKWNISAAAGSTPVNAGTYAAGTLHKTLITNEQGHQTIEYADTYGQVVLKKIQYTATPDNGSGSTHTGWLCTYYVYDDNGMMRYIITPTAVKLIDGTWTITAANADELCYRFEYDERDRMIIKKVPGTATGTAGEIRIVYDQMDRMVMQQDGNLRAQQKWQYLKYDVAGRVTALGLLTDPSNYNNQSYHINNAKTATDYPVLSSYTTELLGQTFYDDYTSWMNTTNSSTLPAVLDASVNGAGNSKFSTTYNTSPLYAQPILQSNMTKGQVTGSKTAVLGSNGSQYIYTVYFYDNQGRKIQTQTINITGEKDIYTVQYDWSGQTLTSLTAHNKGGTNAQTHLLAGTFTYDAQGRWLTTTKTLNSTVNGQVIPQASAQVVANSYTEMGQLKSKQLAPYYNGNTGLEALNYEYNVRGWLLGANRNYLSGSTNNYFGFELGYDKTTSAAAGNTYSVAYNGNITGSTWKSKGDGVNRKFNYSYDNSDRLTAAGFLQNSSAGTWDNAYLDFSVSNMSYDGNGNLATLNRKGFVIGGSKIIDDLTYSYLNGNNSNRLTNVMDVANDPQTKLGDFHYTAGKTSANADYTYDANGNATMDYNRNINTSIVYNYRDLPQTITIAGKGTIQYTYDAAGNKLQKNVTENNATIRHNGTDYTSNVTTTTKYLAGFTYKSVAYSNAALSTLQFTDKLLFTNHEQGHIRALYNDATDANKQTGYAFDYVLPDHTGNARILLTDEKQTDIYPAATLESSTYNGGTAQAYESQFYTINAANVKNASQLSWLSSATGGTYQNQNNGGNPTNTVNPYSNTTANSNQLYMLNGQTGDKTGLGITLKVMAGDQVSILGKSVWHSNGSNASPYPINTALSAFISAFAGTAVASAGLHGNNTDLNNVPATTVPLTDLLNHTQEQPAVTAPKAAINWILFDNQFRPVAMNTELVSSTSDVVKNHALLNIPMIKSGYLYVYCSNESDIDVYFDNVQVVNTRGPLLEETHYYPEGLIMAGISDRAWSKLPNRYGYQGKELQTQEFADGTGLDEYDFGARFYDQQLGVWHTQDLAGQFASPYLAMGNNPAMYVDRDGNFAWAPVIILAVWGGVTAGIEADMNGGNFWDGFWRGAIVGAVEGALGQVGGGGNFLSQVLWGAGKGAVKEGIKATVFKEDNIGGAMLKGAGMGALKAGGKASIESYSNWKGGYGFGTNDGRMKSIVGDYANAKGTPDESITRERFADYAVLKYKLPEETLAEKAMTDGARGLFIAIGTNVLKSVLSQMQEDVHLQLDNMSTSSNWKYPAAAYNKSLKLPTGNSGSVWKYWDDSNANKWLQMTPQRFDQKGLTKFLRPKKQ